MGLGSKIIPSMRFPEFEGKWTKTALGDILTFKNGLNSEKGKYGSGIKFISVLDIINNQTITYDNIIGSVEVTKQEFEKNLVSYGDILFQRSSETREDVGQANVYLDTQKEAVFGGFVIRGKHKADYNPTFMNYLLKTTQVRKEITTRSGGSTRYNIGQDSLRVIPIALPSLPEQQKTADFLSAVDKKIQLLTRKKELLEEYKKGVMRKIFSREIRFKDENGREFTEWEKKRLDEIVMEFIVPMRDKPKQLDGPIPWCRIEDFEGKYLYESKTQQGVTLETVKAMNLKVYPINTLLVSCSANLGFCAITKKELITNQTFIGLFPNQRMVNVQFLLYIMRLSSQRLNTLSSGTTISYLSRKQFEQFEITLPSLPEQDLISEFISKLDGKVDVTQSQISLTQQFKKGLLQQMFV